MLLKLLLRISTKCLYDLTVQQDAALAELVTLQPIQNDHDEIFYSLLFIIFFKSFVGTARKLGCVYGAI